MAATGMSGAQPVVETRGLSREFRVDGRRVQALRDVSLTLSPGETLGIVGESGSGKSTLGRIIAGLDQQSSGQILHAGTDLASLGRAERRARLRSFQMIFQDPYASLNPRLSIGRQIHETLLAGGRRNRAENLAHAARLMERVGLPVEALARFPHEFSGGQRQRIAIARAISTGPSVIVADEPVSALDVTIREQIIALMEGLKDETAYLFISHDMAVVARICDRIAVMYLGQIMEIGTAAEVIGNPSHPYTRALLAAVPRIDRRRAGIPTSTQRPDYGIAGPLQALSPTHSVRLAAG